MSSNKSDNAPPKALDEMIAVAKEDRRQQEKSYRGRALKMFPWICARCGREFSGKKVRELTVHHKDHDHDNNPPDGSNWELLCIYCHENEHARDQVAEWYDHNTPDRPNSTEMKDKGSGNHPFAGLADMLNKKDT